MDGVYVRAGLEREKAAILVVMAALSDGRKPGPSFVIETLDGLMVSRGAPAGLRCHFALFFLAQDEHSPSGQVTELSGQISSICLLGRSVKTLGGSDWKKLTMALFGRPIFAAKLLAGQMLDNIEDVFRDAGLSLFPNRGDDLETDCSCPDWSNPCKHVAAVYLLLGEKFDRDPFLVFKLRGTEREDLLGPVGHQASARSKTGADETAPGSFSEQAQGHSPPEPLPAEPDEFWGHANAEEEAHRVRHIPTISAALPKRLGSFQFWRGKESFIPTLEAIYRKASPAGLYVFLGERRVSERSRAAGPKG